MHAIEEEWNNYLAMHAARIAQEKAGLPGPQVGEVTV
jgi:hypothetical protein